jgi:hypothetical protein
MTTMFPNIADFLKVRETCFFCGAQLWCRLSNLVGIREGGLPLINAPLKDDHFTFRIDQVTPSYMIKAEGSIDVRDNLMVLKVEPSGAENPTPTIDEQATKQTFIDLRPCVQLYCPKKNCPQEYSIVSDTFRAGQTVGGWLILPFKLYYESFISGSLWVCNDYIGSRTQIFSRSNEQAKPITVPLMDFEAMGSKKLLNRVKTIVVFS